MTVKATPKTKSNYTMADIAARMGISPTAVSMALRDSGGVSDKLRQKVLKVAAELDYSPALAARMLRSKNTGQLGLYIPADSLEGSDLSSGFMMPVLAHFVGQCEEKKYSYHIEFGKRSGVFVPPSQLTGRIVDGVLLIGEQRPEMMEWITKAPEYKWVSVVEETEYCVLSDSRGGTYRAVEYLAAMGHREIGLAHCNPRYSVHASALAGYKHAVNDFALGCADHYIREFNGAKGEMELSYIDEWCNYILSHPKRPSAIICLDQKIANVMMMNAAYKGIRIPQDLSIIALGSKDAAEKVFPKTTAIEPDFSVIIEKSIDMLIKRIQNKEIPEKQVLVNTKLVKRDSVAVPGLKNK